MINSAINGGLCRTGCRSASNIIISSLALLLLAGSVVSAPFEEWNRTYKDVGKIFDVQQTQDEGFILAAGDALIKTDAYGSERWIRKFNRPELASREFIQLLKIELTSDGGYILAGSKSLTGDYGSKDVAFVIKTDSYGNEQWNRTFDEDIEKFYLIRGGADSVQQTSDGGYILAEISSRDNYSYARVIKIDLYGNIEWIRKFEKTSLEGASVLQTLDSGYLLATSKVYENNPDFDAWLIKLDTKGNKQWERTFGGKSWDVISSIQLTSDGFILAGRKHSYGSSDALLIKTDTNGNVVWSKTFAGTNSGGFLSVQKTRDGGYILAGYTGADLGSDLIEYFFGDAWLVKVDANGNKQWDMTFGEHLGMFFYSARQTKDGGYIVAGCCGWLAKLRGDNISLLAGSTGAAPPPALLDINGNGQISEIGSYCWSEGGRRTCTDYIGIQTPKEPLITSSTFTANLSLPLQEAPEDVQISIIRVTDDNELKEGTNRTRAWLFKEGNYTRLPAESETDINLSLEPGLYVINVMARWKDKGSASYGFLLEAQIAKEREPSILTVDKSGGANYTRIQDAIDNASDGDTILVYSGTYYESVNVDKKLVLRGIDKGGGKPIVDSSRVDSPTGSITLSAGNSVLEGFTARGSASHEFYYSAGIWVNSHNNQIINNTVSNNPHGITLYHYSSNNMLIGNNVSNNDVGIFLYVSNNNTLSSNNVSKNKGTDILIYYSSSNRIYNNYFSYSSESYFGDTVPSNYWNTTKTPGTNIVGGPYLGGNFWASPNGTGFSQTCSDSDRDGICDSGYTLDKNNIDYLPLISKHVDGEITLAATMAMPAETNKASRAGATEKVEGFEIVSGITIFMAVYVFGRKKR